MAEHHQVEVIDPAVRQVWEQNALRSVGRASVDQDARAAPESLPAPRSPAPPAARSSPARLKTARAIAPYGDEREKSRGSATASLLREQHRPGDHDRADEQRLEQRDRQRGAGKRCGRSAPERSTLRRPIPPRSTAAGRAARRSRRRGCRAATPASRNSETSGAAGTFASRPISEIRPK